MTMPPMPVYAGQRLTAQQLTAMSWAVAALTCSTATNTTTETAIGTTKSRIFMARQLLRKKVAREAV